MDWDIYEEKLDTLLDKLLVSEWPEIKDLVNSLIGLHEIDSYRAEDVLQQRILDVLTDFVDLPNIFEHANTPNTFSDLNLCPPNNENCDECEKRHNCEYYCSSLCKEENVDPCEYCDEDSCDEDCLFYKENEDVDHCTDCDEESCYNCPYFEENEDLDDDEELEPEECFSDELMTTTTLLNTTVDAVKVMLPMELAQRILQFLDENQQELALLTLAECRQDMDLIRAIVENL